MDARDLVADVSTVLQDHDLTRWTAAEIVGYLNDGQRYVVEKSPTATAAELELELVAGARQQVPTNARGLLEVLRNTEGRQRVVSQVARSALDASAPNWWNARPGAQVMHFIADARTPKRFDVYPPVQAGVKVMALLSMEPLDVPEPASNDLDAVTGPLFLTDEYRNALRHYALFRAFSKDSEAAANAELARAHLELCADALGINTGHPSAADDLSQ